MTETSTNPTASIMARWFSPDCLYTASPGFQALLDHIGERTICDDVGAASLHSIGTEHLRRQLLSGEEFITRLISPSTLSDRLAGLGVT
jgi:hypothetical protein